MNDAHFRSCDVKLNMHKQITSLLLFCMYIDSSVRDCTV